MPTVTRNLSKGLPVLMHIERWLFARQTSPSGKSGRRYLNAAEVVANQSTSDVK
jgi:hypothetical protein